MSESARRPSMIYEISDKVRNFSRSVRTAAKDEVTYEAVRFAHTTTAHGIPMALNANAWYGKVLWMCLSLFSTGLFLYQCLLVFEKYQRNDKIVSVKLEFGSANFPAVTICNLNPFKKHSAIKVKQVADTLEAFHQAVTFSKGAIYHRTTDVRSRRHLNPGGVRNVQVEPVMSDCKCKRRFRNSDDIDCVQTNTVPKNNATMCICNYDRHDDTAFPCTPAKLWVSAMCPDCNDIGFCNLPDTSGESEYPCMCLKAPNNQTRRPFKHCLLMPKRINRMWETRGEEVPDEDSPFYNDYMNRLKTLGYENMTDEVAITTKTKEKLVLIMAGMPLEDRVALSYGRTELIKMCSFDSKQCDIEKEFKLHLDPTFGNCFIFNGDPKKNQTSSRAGPSYGLRLLVSVDAADYLPTTEAKGVRITIHDSNEWPFPETFGYSAPTGAVSSFGLSTRQVHRLAVGGDDCVHEGEHTRGYIYSNHKYEPEGCYKSCYQNKMIHEVHCADPRYPTPHNGTRYCNTLDHYERDSLVKASLEFTRSKYLMARCGCKHPCEHNVYTTTYSSARLMPAAFSTNHCKQKGTKKEGDCIESFDPSQTVMLEIYYEQMSYEILTEREAYSFVNFLSDVGGQAGLWLGASVITVFEIGYFAFRVLTVACRRKFRDRVDSIAKFSTTDTLDERFDTRRKQSTDAKLTISSLDNLKHTDDDDTTLHQGWESETTSVKDRPFMV
ncbi:unnamed protein product [Bursaphelenchus okinawaensis]|uniref:Uncharacterized protein n=1 Tax=Bursaphelenchus okinawaensis TaxID=465554 RepID=A0A811LIV9_9BILA|nr:unnamed protein product [Bursaphelenchus okinawaensis]CAG9123200.1 unnamed protein product [Bursaphelenchus okinawaensis]